MEPWYGSIARTNNDPFTLRPSSVEDIQTSQQMWISIEDIQKYFCVRHILKLWFQSSEVYCMVPINRTPVMISVNGLLPFLWEWTCWRNSKLSNKISWALPMKLPTSECLKQDPINDKSTVVQVMAWCRWATSHFLKQCWFISMLSYVINRPQWINLSKTTPQYVPNQCVWNWLWYNRVSCLIAIYAQTCPLFPMIWF